MSNNTTYGPSPSTMTQTTLTLDTNTKWALPEFEASGKNIILAIVLSLLDIVTLLGNGLVLMAFAVDRHLLQPFNLYIFNLAVTDFLVAITAMTFYTIDTLLGYWPFGYAMCCVWIYFDFAMTFASVFTLVAISVDRFWCVTWAVHYKVHNNKTKTGIILGVVWFCVLAIWTPPFISDRLKQSDNHYCIWEPSENKEFVLFVAVIGHYLPCFIMVSCYLKVLFVMKRQARIVASHQHQSLHAQSSRTSGDPDPYFESSKAATNHAHDDSYHNNPPSVSNQSATTQVTEMPTENQLGVDAAQLRHGGQRSGAVRSTGDGNRASNSQSRDRKIFITLTYVLGSYLICWFPFYIAFDTFAWRPELVPSQLYTFFFWMTYVNSTLNPLIYAYTSKEFRTAFRKTIRCLYRCKT